MIVLETSALMAVVLHEPERGKVLEAIASADQCLISALTFYELRLVVLRRLGDDAVRDLDEWLQVLKPTIVPFDVDAQREAFDAYRTWGKGRNAVARLNLVDCAAYALAKRHRAPLLFKGNDFAATDVAPALVQAQP